MDSSKKLARLLGPSMVVVVTAELPLVNPGLYEHQTASGVYGSGMLMFIGGLAIVLAHNIWKRDWRVLNTLMGWLMLFLGLVRLFTASSYAHAAGSVLSGFYTVIELVLITIGFILSYFGYRKDG